MYLKGQISGLSDIDPVGKCLKSAQELFNDHVSICSRNNQGNYDAYSKCYQDALDFNISQRNACKKLGSVRGGGDKPSNSNAFAINTNRFANPISSVVIPQVQTGYAASPLLRNSGLTRLADGGFDWSSIDVTKLSSEQAKSLLNVLPKTNLTPQELAILNLVTAKANQGTNTGGTPSTTPDAEVEDGTKWIYGIAFGVLGGGLLWTILNK